MKNHLYFVLLIVFVFFIHPASAIDEKSSGSILDSISGGYIFGMSAEEADTVRNDDQLFQCEENYRETETCLEREQVIFGEKGRITALISKNTRTLEQINLSFINPGEPSDNSTFECSYIFNKVLSEVSSSFGKPKKKRPFYVWKFPSNEKLLLSNMCDVAVTLSYHSKAKNQIKENENDSPGFRKAHWGMSYEDVKKLEESTPILDKENTLAFKGELGNFNVFIAYYFISGKLTRGAYLINEKHSNRTMHISDYTKLNKLLTAKYGLPDEEDRIWRRDLYKDNIQRWGIAIARGDLVYYTIWKNENTEITHELSGDNFEITHKILYKSKEFEGFDKEERENEVLDDL